MITEMSKKEQLATMLLENMQRTDLTILEQASRGRTHDFYGKYRQNTDLERLYNDMAELGYEISDEELAMLDGTHDMYFKEEENDEQSDADSEQT